MSMSGVRNRRCLLRWVGLVLALAPWPGVRLAGADWQLEQAVVAKVNGSPIYKQELEELAAVEAVRRYGQKGAADLEAEAESKIVQEALRALVRCAIIEGEAWGQGVVVADSKVRERLEESDVPDTDLNRRRARADLLFEELMRKEKTPVTEPTPRQVRDFFHRYREKHFSRPRLVRARQLTVLKALPETRQSEAARIQRFREKVLSGATDFATLAERNGVTARARAQGGLITFPSGEEHDYMFPPADPVFQERGGYAPALIRALVDLPVETVSPVIESEKGFHIAYIEREVPARTHPFERIQSFIYRHLMRTKRAIRQRSWLVRVLRRSHVTWHNGEDIPVEELMPPVPTFELTDPEE